MHTEKPENPSAFPHVNPNYDGNWDKEPQRGGMTLRDYFAGEAMVATLMETQEMVPASAWDWLKQLLQESFNLSWLVVKYKEVPNVYNEAAARCYRYADAMLKERSKQ